MFKVLLIVSLLAKFCFAKVYILTPVNNHIETITKYQLKQLYLKKTKYLNGIKVYVINTKEFYDEFTKKILNKTPNQIHAYWMKQIFLGKSIPPPIISQDQLKKFLNQKENVIGYDNKKALKSIKNRVLYEIK